MCQLLPEVKDVFNDLADGIRRYEKKTTETRKWDKLNAVIEKVDEQADSIKNKIINNSPDFLKEPLRYALYLKKNNDRTFTGYTGTILAGGSPKEFFDILVALDVLDFSVILIDDILDEAERRANRPAHHRKWGTEKTLSVALYLKSLASKMVLESTVDENTRLRILKVMDDFHAQIYEGQLLDVEYETKNIGRMTENDYLEMIALTTGYQIAGSFKTGGILANANEQILKILEEIGLKFGMAGQIRDDLIDYILDEKYTWKTPMLDFKRNKKRIPLIIAWKNAKENEKEEIRELQNKDRLEEQDHLRIISLVMKPENLTIIEEMIRNLENQAKELAKHSSLTPEGVELLKMLFSLIAGAK